MRTVVSAFCSALAVCIRLIEFYYYFDSLLSSLMDCNQFYEAVINIHSSCNLKKKINIAWHIYIYGV